jgi:hypothetical protein
MSKASTPDDYGVFKTPQGFFVAVNYRYHVTTGMFPTRDAAWEYVEKNCERDADHATNIGIIVLALADHEVGDWGDSAINDPVTSIVDLRRPAHELLDALKAMDSEKAAGIVAQITARAPFAECEEEENECF